MVRCLLAMKGDHSSGKVQVVGGDDLEELRQKNVLVVEVGVETR